MQIAASFKSNWSVLIWRKSLKDVNEVSKTSFENAKMKLRQSKFDNLSTGT